MATDSTLVVDVLKTQDLATTVRVEDIITQDNVATYAGGYVNIKTEFGVVGDGTTDDTAAIQEAFDSGKALFFPEGAYLISSTVTKASGALILKGAGRGLTEFLWTGTSGSMIKHTPQTGDEIFDISDITIISNAAPVSMGFAIEIDSSAQMTTETYKGMFVVGEREKRRGAIYRIDIKNGSSTNGFYGFIRATSTLNWSLYDYVFIGAGDTYASEGIAVDGDGAVVDIHIFDGWMYNATVGLYCPDYVEAIYVHDCEWVNVLYGARVGRYVSGRSVLGSSIVGSNAVKLGPMHINAQVCAVDAYKGDYFTCDRMLLVLNNENSPSQLTGFQYESCQYASVDRTIMQVVGDGTVAGDAIFGSVIITSPGTRVNQVFTTGCFFNTYVVGASVSSTFNELRAVGTSAVALQFADTTSALDCDVGLLNADGTRLVNAPAGTRRQLRTYATQVAVTVSGSVATVAVPTYQFASTPTYASLQFMGATSTVGHFNASASTATSLVFNVVGSDGAYAVALFACE